MSLNKINAMTEVKIMLKNVIGNLKALEEANQMNFETQCTLKEDTLELLKKLESLPLESINKQILKRQQIRKRKKLNKKAISAKLNTATSCSDAPTAIDIDTNIPMPKDLNTTLMFYKQTLQVGKRFLTTFNLLERLHSLRSQNSTETYKFNKKLQTLKHVWEQICLEKECYVSTPEEQWNQVLFGSSERKRQKKENFTIQKSVLMKDFLKKRTIWDSYIDLKNGTPIPLGWILPPQNPNSEWSKFLSY